MGPGAHEIHVAAGDVHELRKLIEVQLSEPPPDPGDAVAIVADPLGRPLTGGAHGAKLDQLETLPAQRDVPERKTPAPGNPGLIARAIRPKRGQGR